MKISKFVGAEQIVVSTELSWSTLSLRHFAEHLMGELVGVGVDGAGTDARATQMDCSMATSWLVSGGCRGILMVAQAMPKLLWWSLVEEGAPRSLVRRLMCGSDSSRKRRICR